MFFVLVVLVNHSFLSLTTTQSNKKKELAAGRLLPPTVQMIRSCLLMVVVVVSVLHTLTATRYRRSSQTSCEGNCKRNSTYLKALLDLGGGRVGPNAAALLKMLPDFDVVDDTEQQSEASSSSLQLNVKKGIWDMNGNDIEFPFNKFDFRNPVSTARKVRFNSSYEYLSKTLDQAGFSFCGVMRDLWGCDGDDYHKMLAQLKPFNMTRFIHKVPPQSVIVGEGNSYLAELWAPVLCAEQMLLWKVDGFFSNSFVGYWPRKDVLLLLFDNDSRFNWYTHVDLVDFLESYGLEPTVLTVGAENRQMYPPELKKLTNTQHTASFREQLAPNTPIIERFGLEALNSSTCLSANHSRWGDCSSTRYRQGDSGSPQTAHGCYPGPLFRASEQFWADVAVAARAFLVSNRKAASGKGRR